MKPKSFKAQSLTSLRPILSLVILCLVHSGHARKAASERTSEIFNKNKRLLNPPPRSLRSNKEDLDQRLLTETERLDRLPSSESEDGLTITTQPVTPMDGVQNSNGGNGGSLPVSRVKTNSRRRDRFSGKSAKYTGFDGDRIFAVGFVGAGAYGVFGMEAEFAVDERASVGLGLGTGMTYSTWGLHAKYFFNSSGRLTTFFQAGYANWYMGRATVASATVKPNFLAQRFFFEGGTPVAPKRVGLVYPAIGVQVLNKSGLAFSTQLEYLISLKNFSGGLFGNLAMHFYF